MVGDRGDLPFSGLELAERQHSADLNRKKLSLRLRPFPLAFLNQGMRHVRIPRINQFLNVFNGSIRVQPIQRCRGRFPFLVRPSLRCLALLRDNPHLLCLTLLLCDALCLYSCLTINFCFLRSNPFGFELRLSLNFSPLCSKPRLFRLALRLLSLTPLFRLPRSLCRKRTRSSRTACPVSAS